MIVITTERIKQILSGFRDKKIVVLGDLMVDEYLWGNVTRLSPEAPVPVIEIDNESFRFGGAANVALNIKYLGCDPVLIGVIGNDLNGNTFQNLLKKEKINSEGIFISESRPTTIKTRIIGDNQHIARVDKESKEYLTPEEQREIVIKIDKQLKDAHAVILEDYNKGVLSKKVINYTISLCREKGIPVTVDPKFLNFKEYKGVTFFKPNLKEASQALAKNLVTENEIEMAGFQLLDEMDAESILLTRGSQGLTLFEKNKKVTHIPTLARKVADVSGAGDTVIATLTAAYAGGATKVEAATLANMAAGIVIEEVGIVPVSASKLLE